MREIKFRAWDKNKKHWCSALDLNLFEDIETVPIIELEKVRSGIIIQQFTGLKDKNGKEIYEGDIIKDNDGYGDKEVIFHNGCFVWEVREGVYHIFDQKEVEVIGNVHENPELKNYERTNQKCDCKCHNLKESLCKRCFNSPDFYKKHNFKRGMQKGRIN